MPASVVTVLGKPGCHLCDVAEEVVARVADELAAEGTPVRVERRSILDDPALEARYRDDVPVVLVDDRPFVRWRVDPDVLRARLRGTAAA